jgi:molybdopterin synthase sulfur carrier subunit
MARLSFFGRLTDSVFPAEQMLSLPGTVRDTHELRQWLSQIWTLGDLLEDPTIRIAVNDDIVSEPHPVSDQDRIAFLPPVGGG